MTQKIKTTSFSYNEVIFQIALHVLVFIFYSFDRDNPIIEKHQVALFLNYALAAFMINYFLLPLFYFRKRLIPFLLSLVLVITVVILIEELVLEPYYFPGTRKAENFPGLFFTLLDILPVITILSGFKFAWDAFAKQQELDELKSLMQESEMQFLKSQINPHFLFNNLNNIYAYTVEDTAKAQAILLELSSVLRYMLYECKEKYVSLQKEVEQLENFTQLNELQIEDRGKVQFTMEGVTAGYQIAPLILITFIENAFKHSQSSQSSNIFIDIKIRLLTDGEAGMPNGTLQFTCKNNFETTTNTQRLSKGIGLENVRKRLQLIYPDAHQLNIHQADNLYEVDLTMQLQKSEAV